MASLTPAQERVVAVLRAGPASADTTSQQLGIDPSAARRHLATLAALGIVQAQDVVAGRGRPKRMYQLSPTGRDIGPRNHPALLAMLMQKVSEDRGRKKLLRYLSAIASELAGPVHQQESARTRLDLLLAKYNDLHFESSASSTPSQITLVHQNCPFLTAASDDPEAICRHLDQRIIESAFPGARVELQASMAQGAPECRFIIHHPTRPFDAGEPLAN